MGFYEVANHWLIYVLVMIGILFVAGFALVSLRKSWKRALQLGYEKSQLMTVVKSTVTFTIIPAVAIVVGLFSLAAMLGIPWPWWRLSVVGSVTYETMAAEMALNAAGVDLTSASGSEFILIMFVMSVGIIAGIVTAPFIAKPIQMGTMKMKERDAKWGPLGNGVFMLIIMVVFLVPMLLDFSPNGIVKLLTLVTSAVVAIVISTISKKFKIAWLGNFILAISMILAMASSILWSSIVGI